MANGSTSPGFEDEGRPTFLFNFDQYEKIDKAGVFADRDGRLELIEGRLVEMSPASAQHANVTIDLAVSLTLALRTSGASGLKVLTQSTLRIGDHSAPEPDVFVARPRAEGYYEAKDAALVVEVALTTFNPNQSIKGPMYARAGIPELWDIDLKSRVIHVYLQPQVDGTWGKTVAVTQGAIHPLFTPDIEIALTEIFGR